MQNEEDKTNCQLMLANSNFVLVSFFFLLSNLLAPLMLKSSSTLVCVRVENGE